MSQAGSNVSGGSTTGPIEQLTADDMTVAIPVGGNVNIFTDDTTEDNQNGIQSTASGETVTIQVTNRLTGSGSTTGAVTADIIIFDLGSTPGTYAFEFRIAAFEATTPAAAGYALFGTVMTDGAAGTVIGTPDRITNESAVIMDASVTIVASGNNAVLRVTGASDGGAGYNISWNAVGLYTFVS